MWKKCISDDRWEIKECFRDWIETDCCIRLTIWKTAPEKFNSSIKPSKATYATFLLHRNTLINISRAHADSRGVADVSHGAYNDEGVCASSFSIIPWFFIDEVDTVVSQRVRGHLLLCYLLFSPLHTSDTRARSHAHIPGLMHTRGRFATLLREGWKLGWKKDGE